jgi:hypothetical protein
MSAMNSSSTALRAAGAGVPASGAGSSGFVTLAGVSDEHVIQAHGAGVVGLDLEVDLEPVLVGPVDPGHGGVPAAHADDAERLRRHGAWPSPFCGWMSA